MDLTNNLIINSSYLLVYGSNMKIIVFIVTGQHFIKTEF